MTALTIGSIALVLLALHYAAFLVRVYRGLNRLPKPGLADPTESVSVIVAARNEEKTIRACVDSIGQQDYSTHRWEVLVADDGSTDATPDIVTSMMESMPNLKLIRTQAVVGNKPRAVSECIESAKGDIILLTDADCVVRPGWIKAMVSCLSQTHNFVAGPVVEAPSAGIIQRLSRLEFLGLVGVAAGLIGSGMPIFCNGANIAYRKSAFRQVHGYGNEEQFSDDETLMQRMQIRLPGTVTFCSHPDALVTTAPAKSLSDLWHQRARWSSKRGVYENKRILARLLALYFFFLCTMLATMGSFAYPSILLPLVPVLALKIGLEWLILRKAALTFRQSFSLPHLFIAELIHVPYIVLAALQGQIGSLRWKGAPVRP
ncbi:MAG TPA: glycosyltransferase [Bacteroidota bacterium]